MSEKKVWFNWHCPHCEHRNRFSFSFQFELPQYYSAIWKCEECSRESKIEFDLRVNGWFLKGGKPPRLKKRLKEKKEIKKNRENKNEYNSYKNNSTYVRNKKSI
jgi:hypothetical protein